MQNQIICPNCGAENERYGKCEYCGSVIAPDLIDMEDGGNKIEGIYKVNFDEGVLVQKKESEQDKEESYVEAENEYGIDGGCLWITLGLICISLLFTYGVISLSQDKNQMEDETILKTKADSVDVADFSAKEAEQERTESINAVEAIYSEYEKILDENNGLYEECEYFLEDLNYDEYPELFIKVGNCEANYRLFIYTYNNGMKKIYDDSAGHSYFCRGNDYVLQVHAHMGESSWNKLVFDGNRIKSITIFEEVLSDYAEDYKNPDEPTIDFYTATYKTPLVDCIIGAE